MSPQNKLDELKQQLAQLDALMAQGVLKGEDAKRQRDALERQVLAAVTTPAEPTPAPRVPTKLWATVALFVVLFGAAGYAWRGNHEAFKVGPGENVASSESDTGKAGGGDGGGAAATPTAAQIDEMVQRLANKLKENPNDPTGWHMLARAYSVQGKFELALPAYKQVLDLKPADAQALADYADALAVVNNNSLDGEPEQLVMRAVQIDPNNVKALSLAGTVAFNKALYPQAVSYWERAVQAADPNSGFAQQLQGALSEARKRAAAPEGPTSAATTPAASTPAVAANAAVSGRVVLKATLKDKTSPDDSVFIFARAATGPRMPLAILRKKVSDLPLDFSLDDSMAMSPASRLSSASQVVVGARISKSGNAMPQPGDLQGFSAAVAPGAKGLTIEIGDVVH